MLFKKGMIAALGISMAAAPALAQTASPLSLSTAARSGAVMPWSSSLDEDDVLLPAIVIAAILTAAILLTKDDNDDFGNPISP